MKSIKMLLLIVAITFSSAITAGTAKENAETNAITTDLTNRLKNPKFILENETSVKVTLIVNKNNEFVVLSVDSDNDQIVEYIKVRLNYSKASAQLYETNKTYVLPLRLTVDK